jgi:hypothetical protein
MLGIRHGYLIGRKIHLMIVALRRDATIQWLIVELAF